MLTDFSDIALTVRKYHDWYFATLRQEKIKMSEDYEVMHPMLTNSTFPLLVWCPVCKSDVGVSCTRKVRDGQKFVTWFHFARVDSAMKTHAKEISTLHFKFTQKVVQIA